MASRGRTSRKQNSAKGKGLPRRGRNDGRRNGTTGAAVESSSQHESGIRKNGAVSIPGRLTAPVLVLNLNYVPVNVCTVRRAIVLVAKGKAELLEHRQDEARVRTFNAFLDAPSIIRLVYLVKRPFAPRRLSKKEVFLRDHYTCQYCGKRSQHLTLDHVVPRRQHGPHTWDNVVAACGRCNLDKAGRTPEEANMKLRRVPTAPQPNPYRILENRTILEEWRQYIPWQSNGRSREEEPAAMAMAD
ncbi:MAG: HNH endonuclease [Chloroflexi bacterium]|nr:HNH endonuclease [Chloroflexota bacterium]MYD48831.1 HNH endonuclease [Chloroflexota bacterium]